MVSEGLFLGAFPLHQLPGNELGLAASGGQDISVGATIAVAGSVMLRLLCGADARADTMQTSLILAFVVGCLASMLCGAFNGTLVAYFKIQPMVATLIMYTAGRSIAAWVNGNKLPVLNDPTIAKDIEMDAILAVALGGNALSGGKFSMTGSIIGAYVIQFLTTTLFNFKVPSDALPAYKAVVVIILVVISAPVFRDKVSKMWKAVKGGK